MLQSYEEWFNDLKSVFRKNSICDNLDFEAYRDYYDDDYSPEEAFTEDISYA